MLGLSLALKAWQTPDNQENAALAHAAKMPAGALVTNRVVTGTVVAVRGQSWIPGRPA